MCIRDRFPGAEESLARNGVRMDYLCDWWDVIAIAEKGGYFSTKEIDGVKAFLEDPLTWSAANGGK